MNTLCLMNICNSQEEAAKRGLPNLRNTVEALATLDTDVNRELFSSMRVCVHVGHHVMPTIAL
jgi:glutamine synthetase type III